MSRDILLLKPYMRPLHEAHVQGCWDIGIRVITTYTLRTPLEQVALYAQGRELLSMVNLKRKAAGMAPITDKENARPVTHTMASNHLGTPPDGLACAYDLCIVDKNGCVWDTKVDADHDQIPDWKEVADVGVKLGLTAGYYWPSPNQDPAHFERRAA